MLLLHLQKRWIQNNIFCSKKGIQPERTHNQFPYSIFFGILHHCGFPTISRVAGFVSILWRYATIVSILLSSRNSLCLYVSPDWGIITRFCPRDIFTSGTHFLVKSGKMHVKAHIGGTHEYNRMLSDTMKRFFLIY